MKKWKEITEKGLTVHPTAVVFVTYAFLLLSRLIDVTLLNRDNQYLSVILLQLMVFIVPGAVWCLASGENYLRRLRIRTFRPSALLLPVFGACVIIFGGLLLSMMTGGLATIAGSGGNFTLYDTFVAKNDGTLGISLYLVLAYAVIPAVCEEFVFRAILCAEWERGGVLRAVILSSFFFALLHFRIQNLPVYFFAGLVLAMTMYACRSVLASILAHFLYNLFCLFGQPYMSTFFSMTESRSLFVSLVILLFFGSLALFCGSCATQYKKHLYEALPADYRLPEKVPHAFRKKYLSVLLTPSGIATVALWTVAMILSAVL